MTNSPCDRAHAELVAGTCPWCGQAIFAGEVAKWAIDLDKCSLNELRKALDQIDDATISSDDAREKRRLAGIIDSMTPFERGTPSAVDAERVQRIASGSGTNHGDVKSLLEQFEAIVEIIRNTRPS